MAASSWSHAAVGVNPFPAVRPPAGEANSPGEVEWDSTAFAPLVGRDWSCFSGTTEKLLIPARRELYSQNAAPEFVYFIESGLVKLVRLTEDGAESILGLRSNGWILDAAAAVLNLPHASSGVTLTACMIRRARRSTFMQVLNADPPLTRDLNTLICREVHSSLEQQIELRSGTAQSRLDRLVRELARVTRVDDPLDSLPLKKLEIAQLLSITPEHLSRLLRVREEHRVERSAPRC